MRIVVTGSLAYDYIMTFPGQFTDHILADRADTLTVSFLVDSMRRMRGGVAGNIAYTLALLGNHPLVVATAGQDFGSYESIMQQHGIDTSGIVLIEDEFTASCFINTDRSNNQIVAFYPGAMTYARDLSLLALGLGPQDLVIISPTDPDAMIRYSSECRQIGVPFVFDPGKQTPRLNGAQIMAGLQGAYVLISNEYEFGMLARATGRSEAELLGATPLAVITRGSRGSTIYTSQTNGQGLDIPPAAAAGVVDPTGAGDSYLAGLVFGLAHGFSLPVAGRIAALAAAYTIEQRGCQEHTFTPATFVARYAATFGATPDLDLLATAEVQV